MAAMVLERFEAVVSLAALLPVWRSSDCNVWQRLRYTWVSLNFSHL